MFSAVAVFILFLAVINFMNLSTAKSERRAREVGIRKTFGSERYRLILQFIGEAILTSLIAMLLALLLLSLTLPLFNILLERELSLIIINRFYTILLLIGFVLLVGLLAGSLSCHLPVLLPAFQSFKRRRRKWIAKEQVAQRVVVLQFAVSICLLIGTIVIKKQLDFIQNKNLGFNKDHLIFNK